MAQMTWRTTEDLLERVRRQARDHHRSLNDWVTTVLAAATDPAMAGTEAEAVRERLARAGLLDPHPAPTRSPPTAERVATARAAAGRGTPLSDLVEDARR